MRVNLQSTLVSLAGCCALAGAAWADTPAWVTASNHAAEALLEVQGKYAPESVSGFGIERFDPEILDLKPRTVQRQEADLDAVAAQYTQALSSESDPQVRTDLQILVKAARDQRTTTALQDELMLPYFDLPQALFNGFQQLLDKRVSKSRYPAALVRLKRYAGTAPGYEPIAQLARDRIEERLGDAKLTFPWSVEVEQELKNQDQYLAGIRDLFQKSGLKGWEKDLASLSAQLDAYSKWVRATVLPRARQTKSHGHFVTQSYS